MDTMIKRPKDQYVICDASSNRTVERIPAGGAMKMKKQPKYYVSECPDTGRQFLCQEGFDGNIAELTPATVASMLVTYRQMESTKEVLSKGKRLL
jgi:hypothetical protein